MMTKKYITIGILAYNESKNIIKTLDSLFQQSCFRENSGDYSIDVIVLPNGCTDDTVNIVDEYFRSIELPNTQLILRELSQSGKSNAWNKLVHEFSKKDTEAFVFLDADIEFIEIDTIHNCLTELYKDTHVQVVIDTPVKKIEGDKTHLLGKYLSKKLSINIDPANLAICGQFYCGKAKCIREITMPIGLPVEDGFVLAMVVTNCFRKEIDRSLVAHVKNASHYYEGLYLIKDLIKHEVRIVIGTVINCYLCWNTLKYFTPHNGAGAGEAIKILNSENHNWLNSFIMNEVYSRGYWQIPNEMMFRRFEKFRKNNLIRRTFQLPITLLAFLFDLVVFLIANKKLKSKDAVGYW